MKQYAVELVALTGKHRIWPAMLVAPVMGKPIELNALALTGATIVPLECEQARAEAIVKILQLNYRPEQCYIYEREGSGRWKKTTWKREVALA